MLDAKWVLAHLDEVRQSLKNRRSAVSLDEIETLDRERRAAITEAERLKADRNEASKRIGAVIQSGGDAAELRERVRVVGEMIKVLDDKVAAIEHDLNDLMLQIPNVPHASVPVGADETANRVEKTWGTPRRFDFPVRDHVDLGEITGTIDFPRAAKISGARFAVLSGEAARLERALINFMLDLHTTKHGCREVLPPFIVNKESMFGTGQLPKFEADLFKLVGEDAWYLIPTAEVPVTNLHRDEILDGKDLPLWYCAYTPCFRSEAGSYGKDTRGLIRQHQFDKVELVAFATPETSYEIHEQLTGYAEAVLERLELPYRRVTLCSGDTGFSSAKTYDLEVWLPSQNTYREISSCSNFEDYQARRAQIRYRPADGGKVRLAHTLNGSGLAVGRTLIAIVENYQRADGSFDVPAALRPYLESRL